MNIVLVHGAWADGSGWEGVYHALRKEGFSVSVVASGASGAAPPLLELFRVVPVK